MKSYARGPDVPLIEKTVYEVFEDTVKRHPDREALVSRHQQIRFSYRELEQRVESTAAGLWGLGLRPGDRVGMWASSCAEWVYLQVATARIGAVLVNVNPAYRAHELRYILEKSRMKAIFFLERDARDEYRGILDKARRGDDLPLEHAIALGAPSWEQMIGEGVEPPVISAKPRNSCR